MTRSPVPVLDLNDGRTMPQLGLGVYQTPAEETAKVVSDAVSSGYAAVDTAAIYGNERGVGEALSSHPEVHLTTKLWNDRQGYDSALTAFERSLERLGRDSVDLYLIHWPVPSQDLYVDTWKALIRLREEGRARSIGVSNFQPRHLERIIGETGVVPAVNQIELHPRFQQRALLEVHAAHGIATTSWSPLGRGALLDDPVIGGIARRHGKTPAQVIIRWHIDNGLSVIPKSVRPERVRENIDVFDFSLSDEDLTAIAGLDDAGGRIGPDPDTF